MSSGILTRSKYSEICACEGRDTGERVSFLKVMHVSAWTLTGVSFLKLVQVVQGFCMGVSFLKFEHESAGTLPGIDISEIR